MSTGPSHPGALAHHEIPNAVESQKRLMLGFLHIDEPPARTGHRFADRCRVDRIRLAPFDIRLDLERRHQPDFVTELPDLACPVMGRPERLHTDETCRQLLEEAQKLRTPDRAIEGDVSVRRDAMDLRNILGKIQSYCRNLHRVASFLAEDDICSLAHHDGGGSRSHPPHPQCPQTATLL